MDDLTYTYIYTNNFKQKIQRNFKIKYKSNHLITKLTFEIESIDFDIKLNQEWISSKKNYGSISINKEYFENNQENAILLMVFNINSTFFINDAFYSNKQDTVNKINKIKESYDKLY